MGSPFQQEGGGRIAEGPRVVLLAEVMVVGSGKQTGIIKVELGKKKDGSREGDSRCEGALLSWGGQAV